MKKSTKEKYITVKDVAKEAGVSIATVSRAINDGSISQKRKVRVMDAIAKLDFVPNESARNVAAVRRVKKIPLLLPDIARPYYTEIIKGAKDTARSYKYESIFQEYDYSPQLYTETIKKYSMSSEYKTVIELGESIDIERKIKINWKNEYIKYDKINLEQSIGIYTKDKIIQTFLMENLIENAQIVEDLKYDIYFAPTLDEALHLYNLGVKEQNIYTFANVDEIQKICPNIKHVMFDFYGLGVTLFRIAIKITRDEEDIQELTMALKGINE